MESPTSSEQYCWQAFYHDVEHRAVETVGQQASGPHDLLIWWLLDKIDWSQDMDDTLRHGECWIDMAVAINAMPCRSNQAGLR